MQNLSSIENKMPLILITDENDEMLQYISSLLHSYEILTAQNGKTALDLVYKYHPHVILTNIQLPILSSFELIKSLKSDLHFEHTPIIVFSDDKENKDIERCIEIGADDYLFFPFAPNELESRINMSIRHYNAYRRLLSINSELLNTIQNFLNASEEIQNNKAGLELLLSLTKLPHTDYTMAHALEVFIQGICKLQGWSVGHIYMVDKDQENDRPVLYPSNIWYFDEQKHNSLKEKKIQDAFQNEQGLPWLVYNTKQAHWIEDVLTEESIHQLPIPELEIHTGVGIPILCYAEVIAIAEFFSNQKLLQNKSLLEIMCNAALQLTCMLEQRCNEEKLKIKEEELDKLHQQLNTFQQKIPSPPSL